MYGVLNKSIATREPGLGDSAVGMLFSYLPALLGKALQAGQDV
jgi:hypothetical protein